MGAVASPTPVDNVNLLNPLCNGKKDGFNAIDGNVFHFILCLGANSYVFACPRGLVWSDTSGYCDVTPENAGAHAPGDLSAQTASGAEILYPFGVMAKDFYGKKQRAKRPGDFAWREEKTVDWEGETREESFVGSHEEQEIDASEEHGKEENGFGPNGNGNGNDKLTAAGSGDIAKPFKHNEKYTNKYTKKVRL